MRALRLAVVLSVLAMSAATLWMIVPISMASLVSMRPLFIVGEMQHGKLAVPPSEMRWQETHDAFLEARKRYADDPNVIEGLAYLFKINSIFFGDPEVFDPAMLATWAGYQRQAIALRPMAPYPRANLALALSLAGESPDEMWHAWDKAYAYGQREQGVIYLLSQVILPRWEAAGSTRQNQWRQMLLDYSSLKTRLEIRPMAVLHGHESAMPADGDGL